MSIKKYNESKKCWEVIGSANASEIELTNPEYAKEDGTPSSVSEAFDKISNRIENIEKNVSYIYKNGTLGGGGGGGGGGGSTTDEIVVTNEEINTISGRNFLYISGNSASISFYVKTLGAASKYSITVRYGGQIITGWSGINVYSSKNGSSVQTINLSDIIEEKSLEIFATSSNGIELEKYTIYVRINAYEFSLEGDTDPTLTIDYEKVESRSFLFRYKDGIPNTVPTIQINLNTSTTTRSFPGMDNGQIQFESFNLKDLFGSLVYEVGREYTLSARLSISGTSLVEPIISPSIVKTISIADAGALVVQCASDYLTLVNNLPSGNHTEDEVPNKLTQTDTLIMSIKVLDNLYTTFKVAYRLIAEDQKTVLFELGDVSEPLSETNGTLTSGTGQNATFHLSSLKKPGETNSYVGLYYLEVYVWAVENLIDRRSVKTYLGYVGKSEFIEVFDYCPNNRVVCQYNTWKNFPANWGIKNWAAKRDDAGPLFTGIGGTGDSFANAKVMNIYDTNGVTSGFLNSNDIWVNNTPCLRLSGGAYAVIPYQPFKKISEETNQTALTSSLGFTISITFKSDKHPSNSGTILDIGDYLANADGGYDLTYGYHIGLEQVIFKYRDGNAIGQIEATLVQGRLNVVDLVYLEGTQNDKASIRIYLNGVCTAAHFFESRNDYNSIYLVANSFIWFGGRNTDGGLAANNLNNKCDVNIYDFKINAEGLNPYGIVRNYINSISRTKLNNGMIDEAVINSLRSNNLMTPYRDEATGVATLDCSLCNIDGGQYVFDKSWTDVYNNLSRNSPLPIVYLELTGDGFYETYNNTYNTSETDILNVRFPCIIKYTEPHGGKTLEVLESTGQPAGDENPGTKPEVSLQGTTTLGYAAKNLEIYFGTYDGTNERLFTPSKPRIDTDGKAVGWLPENRFTLKADVVDSAHCNNAAVGKFINSSSVFNQIPPQRNSKNPYSSYVKHTLEGFPIYLFVKYSTTDQKALEYFRKNGLDITIPQFMGIYSFNLGRGSNFNLGFRAFENIPFEYTDGNQGQAGIVSNFYNIIQPVTNYGSGIYSYECNANDNKYGSFQSDDDAIIRYYYDLKYSPDGMEGLSFLSLKKLFTTLSNCYEIDSPVYEGSIDDQGRLNVKPKLDSNGNVIYYTNARDFRNLEAVDRKVDYENAQAYYLLAMAFGMVDSLGKNMTLRCYDVSVLENEQNVGAWKKWYTCFYDMDTCLGLNNFGAQIIKKDAYVNRFWNDISSDGTLTVLQEDYNYNFASSGYSTYNSRLWNTISRILLSDGNIEKDKRTLADKWVSWRNDSTKFANYKHFIDKFYNAQTEGVGEIVYNLDYQIKYFDPFNATDGRKDISSIGFLHGQRKEFVEDWFKDRIQFLDAALLWRWKREDKPVIEDSIYLSQTQIRAAGSTTVTSVELGLVSPSPNLFFFNTNNEKTHAYVAEDVVTYVKVRPADGETQESFNLSSVLSSIINFKILAPSSISDLNLPSITEFDMSGSTGLNDPNSLGGGNTGSNVFYKMVELRTLDLKNMKLADTSAGAPALLDNCTKLQYIDISGSDITSISLPKGGCLETLNIANSGISSLKVTDQSVLEAISFSGCSKLQEVTISGCDKLTSINLDGTSITRLEITSCSGIKNISARNCTKLSYIRLGTLDNLVTLDLSGSSIAIPEAELESIVARISGCPSLQSLNMTNWKGSTLFLNVDSDKENTTLTNLNLNSSRLYRIQTSSSWVPELIEGYAITDLRLFKGLDRTDRLDLRNNVNIRYLKFENSKTPSFQINSSSCYNGCYSIRRIFGHLQVNCSAAFYFGSNHGDFAINDIAIYQNHLTQKTVPANSGNNEQMMDELREVWFSGENVTNVTFNTTSFASILYQSSGTIYDVYYVLSRALAGGTYAKQNVVNLDNFVQGCSGIGVTTNNSTPLGRYTFKYCSEVTSMNSPFCWVAINGPIYSPEKPHNGGGYNGLFSPLKKLRSVGSLFFGSGGTNYIDSYLFYKVGDNEYLPIEAGSSLLGGSGTISVVKAGENNNVAPISSRYFLENLPNLRSTSYMSHYGSEGVTFNFEVGVDQKTGRYFTYFIHGNPLVTDVSGTFSRYSERERGSTKITGTICGSIFGGGLVNGTFNENTGKTYLISNKITKFSNFAEIKSSSGTARIDWTDMNDLFSWQVNRASITDLSWMWGTAAYYWTLNGTNAAGEQLEIGKEYTRPVTGVKYTFLFPNKVFDGMNNLISIPGFFYNHNISGNYDKNQYAELPGDMFLNKTRLEDISYLFAHQNTNNNFVFKFTREGFVNCNLKNVDRAFSKAGRLAKLDEYNGIPYKFFYQGVYNSNPIQMINPTTGAKEGTFTRKILKQQIANMDGCFLGLITMGGNGTGLGSIQYQRNDRDLIDYNYNYDPRAKILRNMNKNYDGRETIVNSEGQTVVNEDYNPIIDNPNYSPNEYTWEEYAWDGIYDVSLTSSHPNVVKYGKPTGLINNNEDLLYYDGNFNASENAKKLYYSNYLIPSDLFRYCSSSCVVARCCGYWGVYMETNSGSIEATSNTYGYNRLHGRLSPILFKQLTSTTDFSELFADCYELFSPYKPPVNNNRGELFHVDTFRFNSKVTSISHIFTRIKVRKNIELCGGSLFAGMGTSLSIADSAFYYSSWDRAANYDQLRDPFASNTRLRSIKEIFRNSEENMQTGYRSQSPDSSELNPGPRFTVASLFKSPMPIQNCERAFLGVDMSESSIVPPLWTLFPTNFVRAFALQNADIRKKILINSGLPEGSIQDWV